MNDMKTSLVNLCDEVITVIVEFTVMWRYICPSFMNDVSPKWLSLRSWIQLAPRFQFAFSPHRCV